MTILRNLGKTSTIQLTECLSWRLVLKESLNSVMNSPCDFTLINSLIFSVITSAYNFGLLISFLPDVSSFSNIPSVTLNLYPLHFQLSLTGRLTLRLFVTISLRPQYIFCVLLLLYVLDHNSTLPVFLKIGEFQPRNLLLNSSDANFALLFLASVAKGTRPINVFGTLDILIK